MEIPVRERIYRFNLVFLGPSSLMTVPDPGFKQVISPSAQRPQRPRLLTP